MVSAVATFLSLLSLVTASVCAQGGPTYLDGPRVPLATASATATSPWQWWYFDMVSPDKSSFRIVYFSAYAFGQISPYPYYAQFSGTFSNGTRFTTIDATPNIGKVMKSSGGGADAYSNGDWGDLGSWQADSTGKYTVNVNSNQIPLQATYTLQSNTPAAYPCGTSNAPNFNGVKNPNLLTPQLGWDVAVPGGKATVNFRLNGQQYTFTGTGYHDSNFGMIPIPASSERWAWTRGVLGPYTFVAFAVLPKNAKAPMNENNPDTWYTSGYLAKDGKMITNFCSNEQTALQKPVQNLDFTLTGAVWTKGAACCQGPNVAGPAGISVTFKIGVDKYTFKSDAIQQQLGGVPGVLPYANWVSKITGGKVGSTSYTGNGMFEILDYRT